MAIAQVLAGAYTSTYGGTACNFTKNGYEIEWSSKGEMIDETDAYGSTIIDFIHLGGNVSCIAECRVQAAGIGMPSNSTGNMQAFYPWAATLGVLMTSALPIGRRASDVAVSFIMTSTASTPSAATPATLTASKAILPPDSNLKLVFNSKSRSVPLKLMFLPSESGGTGTWFTTT